MRIKLLTALTVMVPMLAANAQQWTPSDPQATPEAKALFTRLHNLQKKGCMYGHQDDLLYGYNWWNEPGRSDTKEITGDYPALTGFELGELELGGEKSLDGVMFSHIIDRAKWFYKQNGIITISWHVVNPISSKWPGKKEPNGAGSAWDVGFLSADGDNAVRSILPGGPDNAMFNSWLDRLASFFMRLRDDNGKLIPFIFRPWHEHSGSFFWWGKTRCTDEEYARLWRYTVDYLRAKGLHNILVAYNTDKFSTAEEYMAGYPGDEYIDMLTFDFYGQGEQFNRNVENALKISTDIAARKHKLHALSECGPLSVDLQNILTKFETSYALTWRNAPRNPDKPSGEPLRINPNDPIKIMKSNAHFLFLNDIKDVK